MHEHEILNTLTTMFYAEFSACAVEWPNVDLDTSSLSEWVRFSIRPAMNRILTLQKRIERRGNVYIQVFVKPNTGFARANEIAFAASQIFDRKIVNGIEFDAPDTDFIGRSVSDKIATTITPWSQITVAIGYRVL